MFAQVTFKIKQEQLHLPNRDIIVILLAEDLSVPQIIEKARSQAVINWYESRKDMTDTRKLDEQLNEKTLRFDLLATQEQEPTEVKFIKYPTILI